MKILISTLAFAVALAAPAAAADFTGRWEIAGRQFGMFPSFLPLNDGRLEIAASNGANYTARYNTLSFTGALQKDGLHLNCTMAGKPCGNLLLQEFGGRLSGSGTIAGEPIDITGKRPVMRPYPAGERHDFTPKQFHTLYSDSAAPALHIFPGDSVHTETVDNRGYDGKNVLRSAHGNPLTGPFYVEGAMPGDTLVVHLTRVRLN
ncbi:MAG TPA: hypothetical protein VNY75_10720, partial [Rhizomicrobium sp.]|nr:hypothetical protein [Rhizomicrobium sp.]